MKKHHYKGLTQQDKEEEFFAKSNQVQVQDARQQIIRRSTW